MSETATLQGEETALVVSSFRKRMLWIGVPSILVIGGVSIWLLIRSPDIEPVNPEELKEIVAAKAPVIVPAERDSMIDVPANVDATDSNDDEPAGPTYIPPAIDDVPVIPEPLDMPPVDLLRTNEYDERRSKLLDALHASPIIEVAAIPDVRESASVVQTKGERIDEEYSLTPGSIIPSVLLQGINTDLPGIAVAQVSRDVYDSNTGAHLLIPRGSRVFGTYGSDLLVSDQRVLVTWKRIDLPNGEEVELTKVVGADQSGNAGMKDQVHRRTGKALTVTGLTSLITAGLTHTANAKDPTVLHETSDGRFVQEPSFSADATQEIAREYGDIVSQIAQRHLDRGATLTIRPGYKFTIQIGEELRIAPFTR